MQPQNELISTLLAAFAQESDIDLHAYPINITYKDTLRLDGEVPNIIAKRKARRIALQLSGLSNIDDRLHVSPGEQRQSNALLEATVEVLSQEPAFRDIRVYANHASQPGTQQWISVSVDSCVVRLDGQVSSLSHRRLAEVITWWVPGTCNVHNRLHVQPAEQDSDAEITDAIRLVLEKDPLLHVETISAKTDARVVYLEGYVHSQEQRRMAVYDCWYVPGVHDVKDNLRLLQ
jgi:osmotically-inducible protein OsmY